jgi:hypothetical protein
VSISLPYAKSTERYPVVYVLDGEALFAPVSGATDVLALALARIEIVLLEPLFCLLSHFVQSLKHKHIEHRFTVAAIESFDETVLHGLAGFDELERYAMLLSPVSQSQRDELGPVVQSELDQIAADSGYLVKLAHDPEST